MRDGVFLGFDFGYRRIGVAVGQYLTCSASPLSTIFAKEGVPDWHVVDALIKKWRPTALIVGLPTRLDESEMYTTRASREFAEALRQRFSLPVHMVDERMTTVEARTQLFSEGGYRKIKKSEVDSLAACLILEQWLKTREP